MNDNIFCGSLTRTTDLESQDFDCEPIPRDQWEAGDYVVGDITIPRGGISEIELTSGRLIRAVNGDLVLGALGIRHATLEVVGSYEAIGHDGRMDLLTARSSSAS
jgi:hypothetical protein